ncbi:MAG: amidohydrolase family protein, partial [Gemmataceae bacterium]
AYGAGREADLGTLTAGKLADLVVLSRDILAAGERDRIGETKVDLTVVGGKVVYERGK